MKNKKIIALATAIVLSVQTGFATNITGVSGADGVYNINPEMINGANGFRRYDHFYLSDGDVANLIMQLGGKDIGTFINLVDNKVNIQGILNTMRNGQFVDGHAVFITPKGMVVGQNGVLNVGSLSVLTPNANTFNALKEDPISTDLASLQNETNGEILLRGTVLSRGDVNLRAGNVILPESAAIVNGVKDNILVSSLSQAKDILFNNLVNTDNLSKANVLAQNDGKIILKSSSQNGVLNVRGTVQNLNNGEVKFLNDNGNIKVTGDVYNANGNMVVDGASLLVKGKLTNDGGLLSLNNKAGKLHINSGAKVNANTGSLRISNNGGDGLAIYGDVVASDGDMYIENTNGQLYVAGNVDYKGSGNAHIVNSADAGQLMIAKSGKINSDKNLYVKNESNGGLFVNGNVTAKNDLTLDNRAGDLTVNNNVKTTNGNLSLVNLGNKLAVSSKATVEANGGDLTLKNEGAKGMALYGNLKSNGNKMYVENTKGQLYIAGNVEHKGSGEAHIVNGANAGQLMIAKSGKINSDKNLYVKNESNGGLFVNGNIETKNDLTLDNKAGDLTVNNNIKTTNGNLSLMNTGNKLAVSSKANVSAKGGNLVMKNEGANGLLVYGNVENDGETISIRNTNGNLTINGKVNAKSGNIGIINEGNLLQLTKNSVVENAVGKTNIVNNGLGGMKAYGKIVGNDDISLVNENGQMYVDGEIIGNKSNIGIYSQKQGKGIYIKETARIHNVPLTGDEKVGDVVVQDTSDAGGSGVIIRGDVKANNDVKVTSINNNVYTSGKVEGRNNVVYKGTAVNGKVSFTADSQVVSGDGDVDYILKNNTQIYYLPAYNEPRKK